MPHRPRSQPWPDIRAFYADLARERHWQIEPMLDLVQFIEKSPYASGLFPYTSHADLHVGRVADFACGDNELTIVYDTKAKKFKFTISSAKMTWSLGLPSALSMRGRASWFTSCTRGCAGFMKARPNGRCLSASGRSESEEARRRARPNPSIERTPKSQLRCLSVSAHVER